MTEEEQSRRGGTTEEYAAARAEGRAEGRADVAENGGGPAVGTRLSAREIHDNVKESANEELRRPFAALAWSAVEAGLAISFSFLAAGYLASLLGPESSPEHRHALAAAAYPLGFIFVVLARSQLFTENTLEPLVPLFDDFRARTLLRVLRLYGIVLAFNLLGALLIALVVAQTPAVRPELHASLSEVARTATEGGFVTVFYKAIFAGWLIALMAWLVASTRATGAQIVLVWLTTAPIAALGFRHSIAGAVEAFYRAGRGEAGWAEMVVGFVVPAVLGNVLGGGTIVALLNHGKVSGDKERERQHLGASRRWHGFE